MLCTHSLRMWRISLLLLFAHQVTSQTFSVTKITSNYGYITETITIEGSNFEAGAVASIGDASNGGITCTTTTFDSASKLLCEIPEGSLFNVNIFVTQNNEQQSSTETFTYSVPNLTAEKYGGRGYDGETITIDGWGFSQNGTVNGTTPVVSLNGTACNPTTWASQYILYCAIPENTAAGTHNVTVDVNGKTVNRDLYFTYQTPTITAISPNRVLPGEAITISGQNFGTRWQNVQTPPSFGGVVGTNLLFDSDNQVITCSSAVPSTASDAIGAKDVIVSIGSNTGSISSLFTYMGPTVTSVSPAFALAATTITLFGSYFGSKSSDFTPIVSINGTACGTSTYVSDTSALCVVPVGIGEGLNSTIKISGAGEYPGALLASFGYLLSVTQMEPLTGFDVVTDGPFLTLWGTNFDVSLNDTAGVSVGGESCSGLTWGGNSTYEMYLYCKPPTTLWGTQTVVVTLGTQTATSPYTIAYPSLASTISDGQIVGYLLLSITVVVFSTSCCCGALAKLQGFNPAMMMLLQQCHVLGLLACISSSPEGFRDMFYPFKLSSLQVAPWDSASSSDNAYDVTEAESAAFWAFIWFYMILMVVLIAQSMCKIFSLCATKFFHYPQAYMLPGFILLLFNVFMPISMMLSGRVLFSRFSVYGFLAAFHVIACVLYTFVYAIAITSFTIPLKRRRNYEYEDHESLELARMLRSYKTARGGAVLPVAPQGKFMKIWKKAVKTPCIHCICCPLTPCLCIAKGIDWLWYMRCQPTGHWHKSRLKIGMISVAILGYSPRGRLARISYAASLSIPFFFYGLGNDLFTAILLILTSAFDFVYTLGLRPASIKVNNDFQLLLTLFRGVMGIIVVMFSLGLSESSYTGEVAETVMIYIGVVTVFLIWIPCMRDIWYGAVSWLHAHIGESHSDVHVADGVAVGNMEKSSGVVEDLPDFKDLSSSIMTSMKSVQAMSMANMGVLAPSPIKSVVDWDEYDTRDFVKEDIMEIIDDIIDGICFTPEGNLAPRHMSTVSLGGDVEITSLLTNKVIPKKKRISTSQRTNERV